MSANFVAPGQQRYLRACMVCSIVMTYAVSITPMTCLISVFRADPLLALSRRGLPKLRGVSPPPGLAGPDRQLHVPGLRGAHHARRPGQVVGGQVAAPGQVRARRLRDQGVGAVAGRCPDDHRGGVSADVHPVSFSRHQLHAKDRIADGRADVMGARQRRTRGPRLDRHVMGRGRHRAAELRSWGYHGYHRLNFRRLPI